MREGRSHFRATTCFTGGSSVSRIKRKGEEEGEKVEVEVEKKREREREIYREVDASLHGKD